MSHLPEGHADPLELAAGMFVALALLSAILTLTLLL